MNQKKTTHFKQEFSKTSHENTLPMLKISYNFCDPIVSKNICDWSELTDRKAKMVTDTVDPDDVNNGGGKSTNPLQ